MFCLIFLQDDGKTQNNDGPAPEHHQDVNFQATPEDLVNQSTSSSGEVEFSLFL